MEREVLGLYVSGHPLGPHLPMLREYLPPISGLAEMPDGSTITVVGLVNGIKRITTRTNQPMMFVSVEDGSGQMEAVVLPQLMPQATPVITEHAQVILTGTLEHREDQAPTLLVKQLAPLGEHLLFVELNLGKLPDGAVVGCYELLRQYPGKIPVFLKLIKDGKRAVSLLTEELWVVPDQRLVQALKRLGCQVVMTHGAS